MMNFESVNLEGLEGPQNGVSTQITSTDNGDGFDLFKRMIAVSEDEQWRESKPEKKSHDLDAPRAIVQGSSSFPSLSTGQQGNKTKGSDDISGYGEMSSSMHGPVWGAGGPFTPSQRSELQHQILIYKYIHANVAVPHNLLLALNRAPFNPKGHSGLPYGSYAPNQSGCGGSFHPSCSGNIDPELGRCRRTMGRNGGARGMQFLIKNTARGILTGSQSFKKACGWPDRPSGFKSHGTHCFIHIGDDQ